MKVFSKLILKIKNSRMLFLSVWASCSTSPRVKSLKEKHGAMIKAPTYSLHPFDFMMAQRENLRLVVNMMLGIQVLSSDSENSNNHSHAYQKPSKKVNELFYGWEIMRETRPFIVLSSRTFSDFAHAQKQCSSYFFLSPHLLQCPSHQVLF